MTRMKVQNSDVTLKIWNHSRLSSYFLSFSFIIHHLFIYFGSYSFSIDHSPRFIYLLHNHALGVMFDKSEKKRDFRTFITSKIKLASVAQTIVVTNYWDVSIIEFSHKGARSDFSEWKGFLFISSRNKLFIHTAQTFSLIHALKFREKTQISYNFWRLRCWSNTPGVSLEIPLFAISLWEKQESNKVILLIK